MAFNKRSAISRLLTLGAALCMGAALAETGAPNMPCGQRAYMDADGDGVVTKQEFMEGHEKKFDSMDANGDGVLDGEERMAHHRHKRGGMMGKGGCPQGMGMGRPAE